MTEYGYVGTGFGRGSVRRYHSNENCPNLPENPIEKKMQHIEKMELSECQVCSGDVDRSWSGEQLAAKIRRGEYNGDD